MATAGCARRSRLALALLAATMLTPPDWAEAAPGEPVGGEFQVNSFTDDVQGGAAVAMDADGDFVVAWSSYGQDGDGYGVFAQRYSASGNPLGGEFQVNSTTALHQYFPAVAMDADGDFVVTWMSLGQDGSLFGVYAQRYDVAGGAQGGEFRVGSSAPFQSMPAIAMDADGDFVVTWEGEDSDGIGVVARRYDALGVALGAEFPVNSTETNSQDSPALAMDADGDFVVTWQSYGQDGSYYGIYAQRYDAAGHAQGGEFQVNTTTSDWQSFPSAAMDADGDFVVTWQSYGQDGDGYGIYARRYDAAGTARDGEFRVNTFATGSQALPSVAMDRTGAFVVSWTDLGDRDGNSWSVQARRFAAAGTAETGEFRVNTSTLGPQAGAAVAMDADGDFVVSWTDYAGLDGSFYGVFGQRFEGPGQAIASDFNADGMSDILWRNVSTGSAVIWQMNGIVRDAKAAVGAPDISWRAEGIGDFDGDHLSDILWRNSSTGAVVVWRMDGFIRLAAGPVGTADSAWNVKGAADFDGDGKADILWRNVETGNAIIWRMDGLTTLGTASIGSPSSDWQVAGAGDFDGDGKADILWRNATTETAVIWRMDGLAKLETRSIGSPSSVWSVAGVDDFDGGGKADILWRNASTGTAVIWQMNGFTKEASAPIGGASADWAIVRLGDYNGRGQADILWRNADTGGTVIWQMNGLVKESTDAIGTVSGGWEVQ